MAKSRTGLILALAAVLGSPAGADWLVTRDGSRVETKGPWTVKGAQVVFRQTNGTLSALKLADVDLDASAVATAKAKEAAAKPNPTPTPPREPILRLTEKDFPSVEAQEEKAEKESPAADAKPNEEPLAVTTWDSVTLPQGAGVEIFGTVTNRGKALVTAGTVAVSLYDADGGILVTESAQLSTPALPPGGAATFRVQFPGLLSFAEAKFAVASQGYRTMTTAPREGQTPPPAGDGSAPPPGDSRQ